MPSTATCIQLVKKKGGKNITTTTIVTKSKTHTKEKWKEISKEKAFEINAKFEDVGLTED